MKVAYVELQLTVARLVYLFEITPERPEELKKNFDILDHSSKTGSRNLESLLIQD